MLNTYKLLARCGMLLADGVRQDVRETVEGSNMDETDYDRPLDDDSEPEYRGVIVRQGPNYVLYSNPSAHVVGYLRGPYRQVVIWIDANFKDLADPAARPPEL